MDEQNDDNNKNHPMHLDIECVFSYPCSRVHSPIYQHYLTFTQIEHTQTHVITFHLFNQSSSIVLILHLSVWSHPSPPSSTPSRVRWGHSRAPNTHWGRRGRRAHTLVGWWWCGDVMWWCDVVVWWCDAVMWWCDVVTEMMWYEWQEMWWCNDMTTDDVWWNNEWRDK